MTHLTEPRAIGNHADMGASTPEASRMPLTVRDIFRAGVRRVAGRRELAVAQATWDSEGGATEYDGTDEEGAW
jgi:hypothetical protein